MGDVVSFSEHRKRKAEAHETMHLVLPTSTIRNPACAHCRACSICGEKVCNTTNHKWTTDEETWALHTHPCTKIVIIEIKGE